MPTAPELEQALPVGDGWQLLQRRPDIRAAERSLAAATAMIGVETAELYPRVTLGASSGVAGTPAHLLSANSFGANIGPVLSWHWPNRRMAKARIAAAGANADAALASFDGAVLQALRQTETALSACTQELERERSLAQARGDAARAAGRRSSSTVSAGSIFSMCFRLRPHWQMRSPHWPHRARTGSIARWICSCHWAAVGAHWVRPRTEPVDPFRGGDCTSRRVFRKVPRTPVFIHALRPIFPPQRRMLRP